MTPIQKIIETTRKAWFETPPSYSKIITAVHIGRITLAEAVLAWPHLFGENA